MYFAQIHNINSILIYNLPVSIVGIGVANTLVIVVKFLHEIFLKLNIHNRVTKHIQ